MNDKPDWESIRASNVTNNQDAVRRIEVPGGWLYQVQHNAGMQWHPPVFVPALVIEER